MDFHDGPPCSIIRAGRAGSPETYSEHPRAGACAGADLGDVESSFADTRLGHPPDRRTAARQGRRSRRVSSVTGGFEASAELDHPASAGLEETAAEPPSPRWCGPGAGPGRGGPPKLAHPRDRHWASGRPRGPGAATGPGADRARRAAALAGAPSRNEPKTGGPRCAPNGPGRLVSASTTRPRRLSRCAAAGRSSTAKGEQPQPLAVRPPACVRSRSPAAPRAVGGDDPRGPCSGKRNQARLGAPPPGSRVRLTRQAAADKPSTRRRSKSSNRDRPRDRGR